MSSTGWQASIVDGRDFLFHVGAGWTGPARVTLVDEGPVVDQRDVPCCVSAAIARCAEVLYRAQGLDVQLSVLFHYYVSRPVSVLLDPISIREGLRAAVRRGICLAAVHAPEFTVLGALHEPSDAAYADALERRILGFDSITKTMRYWRLDGADRVDAWRKALAEGAPVVFGFLVTDAYRALSAEAPLHGTATVTAAESGHAATVVGYEDETRIFLVRDCRGPDFAASGSWQIDYDAVASDLVHESWAIGAVQLPKGIET